MYITLPSDTYVYSSSNTTNHFRVQLPTPLSFSGNWEVALVHIQYPVSWNAAKAAPKGRVTIDCVHNDLRIPIHIHIPQGHYQNITDLIVALQHAIAMKDARLPTIFYKADLTMYKIQMLKVHDPDLYAAWIPKVSSAQEKEKTLLDLLYNPKFIPAPTKFLSVPLDRQQTQEALTKEQIEALQELVVLTKNVMSSKVVMKQKKHQILHDALKFDYSKTNQRVTINWQPSASIKRIQVDYSLLFIFGFASSQREIHQGLNIADYNVDISSSESSFSIYCNIVEPQIVGNSLEQLLCTVPVNSKALGNVVYNDFAAPQYIDILTRQFDTVEIWITNDTGQPIDFHFGKVILKLHFRRKTLLTR